MYVFLFPIAGHVQTARAKMYQFPKEISQEKGESEPTHILFYWELSAEPSTPWSCQHNNFMWVQDSHLEVRKPSMEPSFA